MSETSIQLTVVKQSLYLHQCSACLARSIAHGTNHSEPVVIHPEYRQPCGTVTGWLLCSDPTAPQEPPFKVQVEECNAVETSCPCFAEYAEAIQCQTR